MLAKLVLISSSCVLLAMVSAAPAAAQSESSAPSQIRQSEPPVMLTPQQLQSFSELTGDARKTVLYRLSTNPKLSPLAATAADARTSRRSTGKVMAIVGFTILGVGDIAGTYLLVTTPGYPNIESGHQNRIVLSAGIALGSLAIGLALAIPGLVKMARMSEAEQRALDVYSPGWQDMSYQSPPPQALGKTIVSPLWSSTF